MDLISGIPNPNLPNSLIFVRLAVTTILSYTEMSILPRLYKSPNRSCKTPKIKPELDKFQPEYSSISMQIPEIGDCIGSESSGDLESDVQSPPHRGGIRMSRRMEAAANKQYPPPIPSLARTDSHPSGMPWVLQKYYTDDGRLIIREERVKHHEFFLADRSNGRLVLNLVHLDDVVEDSCKECHAPEEEIAVNQFSDKEIGGRDEGINDPMREEMKLECYKYNGMGGVNPCGGFVATSAAAAPMLRSPVHT